MLSKVGIENFRKELNGTLATIKNTKGNWDQTPASYRDPHLKICVPLPSIVIITESQYWLKCLCFIVI